MTRSGFIKSYPTLLLVAILLASCGSSNYFYKAGPIDAKLIQENGKIRLEGPSVFQLRDSFVWCGSPIQIKDKYFLFYSAWESGSQIPPFGDSWVLYSKIGCAVSDSPYGNFKSMGIFLKGRKDQGDSTAWDAQMVHNPLIKTFNGKYYLYYGSSNDPGIQTKGSSGENLTKRNRVQQNQKIGVIEFKSIDDLMAGRFKRFDQPLLAPRTRVKPDNVINSSPHGTIAKPDNLIVVNPAVEYRPSDGKYLLVFKGNMFDPTWRGVHGVAIGDSPIGPFTATDQFIFDVETKANEKVSAEDPFIWYHHKKRKFYAVMKDFTGKLTSGEPALAMMESVDGLDWKPSPKPLFMKKELILKDGSVLKVQNLERPQLLLDKHDNPVVLFAACSIDPCGPKTDGSTFNVQIPLEKVKFAKQK
jgi:hypothetical protein